MDENSPVRNQLLVGVGVLLAVALLIGGIVGLVAIKAADVAGLGGDGGGGDTDTGPPVGLGTNTPPSETPSPSDTTSEAPSTSGPTGPTTPTETSTTTRRPREPAITLRADPSQAGTYERVNLTGTYRRGEGAVLQVQRRLPGESWTDFPTDASVSAGTFTTYIETGQTGANEFRVVDTATGQASNTVTVRIG